MKLLFLYLSLLCVVAVTVDANKLMLVRRCRKAANISREGKLAMRSVLKQDMPTLNRTGWLELTNEERDARRRELLAMRRDRRVNWHEMWQTKMGEIRERLQATDPDKVERFESCINEEIEKRKQRLATSSEPTNTPTEDQDEMDDEVTTDEVPDESN